MPASITLTNYTGPCTITVANTVIDSKTVTCATLDIRTTGVVIKNSMLNGVDVNDDTTSVKTYSFMIMDSTVVNGGRDQCQCVGTRNFVASRVEVRGGNRSMYCASNCMINDSWLHGQVLVGAQHGSGLRQGNGSNATHNTLSCTFPDINDATSLGCSAPETGYGDFEVITHNTNTKNLYVSTPQGNCSTCDGPSHVNSSFCSYGGNTAGKPHSNDPGAGTFIVYDRNVFQKGPRGVCGEFGVVGDYAPNKTGNSATGNLYDDGSLVPASQFG